MSVIVYGKRAIVTDFILSGEVIFLHGINIFNVIFLIVRLFSHLIILRCNWVFLNTFVCMCGVCVCVLGSYI